MKKLSLFLVTVVLMLVFASSLFAVETVTPSWSLQIGKVKVFKIAVTTAADGTVAAYPFTIGDMTKLLGKYLCEVETDPGTAPTTLYDITITDANGLDLLGGAGADRSATVTQQIVPILDSTTSLMGCRLIKSQLTLNITNNSVDSATVSILMSIIDP